MSDAETERSEDFQAGSRQAVGRGTGPGVLGFPPARLRGQGLSDGHKDLCRPSQLARRDQTGLTGPPPDALHRRGAQARDGRDRAYRARRGSRGKDAGTHRRRARRALHGGPCRGQLQRQYDEARPGDAGQPHSAGAGFDGHLRGRNGRRRGAALFAARDATSGEQHAQGLVQDVLVGRGVGDCAAARQPVPPRDSLQGRQAGAFPDAGRVSPGRSRAAGARRGGAQMRRGPLPPCGW